MYQPIQLTNTIPSVRNSLSPTTARRGFLLIPLAVALASFALLPAPKAFGVSPAPDGGYPNQNTAEGANALVSLTTGVNNTAIGFDALLSNTTGPNNTAEGIGALLSLTSGSNNTANGAFALLGNTTGNNNTASGLEALFSNTTGNANTASGLRALFSNTTGLYNTAEGANALSHNTTGGENTAEGTNALFSNTIGSDNTATGFETLVSNTTGTQNTANGWEALFSNTDGSANTATGLQALLSNTSGNDNTAIGLEALSSNTIGSNNIAIGTSAGTNLSTGDNNIDIGNSGVAGEANTIRIGIQGTQSVTFIAGISGATASGGVAVFVNSSGQLGTLTSSARFKQDIHSMDGASEAILALKPVTFRYKQEIDPKGIPQFGLVAEEVEQVNPDLVVRDAEGKAYSVRYEAVNAMLLNEFLKEHREVEEQQATIAQLKSAGAKQEAVNAEQRKEMQLLGARLKRQESQIQKVSAQLQINSAQRAARLVNETQ